MYSTSSSRRLDSVLPPVSHCREPASSPTRSTNCIIERRRGREASSFSAWSNISTNIIIKPNYHPCCCCCCCRLICTSTAPSYTVVRKTIGLVVYFTNSKQNMQCNKPDNYSNSKTIAYCYRNLAEIQPSKA